MYLHVQRHLFGQPMSLSFFVNAFCLKASACFEMQVNLTKIGGVWSQRLKKLLKFNLRKTTESTANDMDQADQAIQYRGITESQKQWIRI